MFEELSPCLVEFLLFDGGLVVGVGGREAVLLLGDVPWALPLFVGERPLLAGL